jgi:hypothetical protein
VWEDGLFIVAMSKGKKTGIASKTKL